jgi:hypothetical protein
MLEQHEPPASKRQHTAVGGTRSDVAAPASAGVAPGQISAVRASQQLPLDRSLARAAQARATVLARKAADLPTEGASAHTPGPNCVAADANGSSAPQSLHPAPLERLLARAVQARADVLARKVADLPTEGLSGGVLTKVAKLIELYNKSPLISTLESADLKRDQIDMDGRRLNAISEYLSECPDAATEGSAEYKLTIAVQDHTTQLKSLRNTQAKHDVAGRKAYFGVPDAGAITFRGPGFPRAGLIAPLKHTQMFAGVSHIPINIGGKPYRLYAGQDYLNPGESVRYRADPKTIKDGAEAIPVLTWNAGQQDPVTKELLVDEGAAMLADKHHRFVWSAYHGLPLKADPSVGTSTAGAIRWSALTYKLHPKHEYEFGAKPSVDDEVFFAAMSPLPEYAGKAFGEGWEEFLRQQIRIANKDKVRVSDEELGSLRAALLKRRADREALPFEDAVKTFASLATGSHTKKLGQMLLDLFRPGDGPTVADGPAPSEGYYITRLHVIVVDPKKNADADAKLDTLAFEAGNALRRSDYVENKPKADVEFEVVDAYVAMLRKAVGDDGIFGLLLSFGIDEKYWQRFADPVRSIAAGEFRSFFGDAVMPPKAEMPEQRKRSSYAAFLQMGWKEADRRAYFGASPHAEGMNASAAVYA